MRSNDNTVNTPKKVALYGVLIAVGSAIYVIESYVPMPVPIPGARWGFSNLVIVYVLPFSSFGGLISLVVGKSLLGALLTGKIFTPTFFMGFSGSFASACAMFISYRLLRSFGLVFHSVIGALTNNVIQVLIGAYLISSWMIFSYLPYMEILAVISGSVNGFVGGILMKRTKVL